MKTSPLTTVLLLILVVSALASVTLCWLYMSNVRQSRAMQEDAMRIQNNKALIVSLANDAVEYGKKNSAIEPILENARLIPPKSGSGAAASKPTAK
jgi:hypothetical protein